MEHATTFLGWIVKQPAPTVWAIEVEGEAAGGIGIELHTDVERVSAEIGYWLGERHWSRGIATEALRAVTAEAFKRFEITRLYAVPFADHAASVRVLEKAGYVKEGHLRQSAIKDGKVRDQLLVRLLQTTMKKLLLIPVADAFGHQSGPASAQATADKQARVLSAHRRQHHARA